MRKQKELKPLKNEVTVHQITDEMLLMSEIEDVENILGSKDRKEEEK